MEQSRLTELVKTADRRALYINQVEHAKERFRTLNVLAWKGHIFDLTPNFLAYVVLQFMSSQLNDDTPVILLDKNDEPVLVMDIEEFVDQMQEKHTEALNDYHDRYQRLVLAKSNEELIEVV